MDDDDSTASPSKKGVWRSCYLDYRHNECLKDGVLTGAGFVVLLGCLVFAMSAIFAPKVRHTRLVLFTLAGTASIWTTTSILLTRTIFCVHYGLDSRAWLLVTIQWFKIQQYTLPFGIFLAYTAKSAGYTDWPSSLIWPCHLLFAALTAGVVVYTAVTEDTYQQVCAAPGWMVLSSFGLGQAGLYCLVSAYVVSKVRRRFIPPVWQSCRRLFIWGCICLLAPIAQCQKCCTCCQKLFVRCYARTIAAHKTCTAHPHRFGQSTIHTLPVMTTVLGKSCPPWNGLP
eukprot:m.120930 g.120930  ORF g.120930 m.120930 type:complete len:284 (-) comp15621_c0_seq36:205-1056(-)